MLPFPCYHVGARFDAGMSGGPVFDEYGSLCGLVCASLGSGLTFTTEASRRESANDNAPEHALVLRASMRW